MIKRTIDLGLALMGILLLFPCFLVFYAFICLRSQPKLLFVHDNRVGRKGRYLRLYRFELSNRSNGVEVTGEKNGKVKPNGLLSKSYRLLRLEYLPPLFNILKGDLSFVGPRPETPKFYKYYDREEKHIFDVRPGILSPPHEGESNGTKKEYKSAKEYEQFYKKHILPKKIEAELHYVQNRQLGKDFRVILDLLKTRLRLAIDRRILNEGQSSNFFLPMDLFFVLLSYFLAYQLRFEWNVPSTEYIVFFKSVAIVLTLRILVFYYFGMYKNLWKYVGIKDLISIIASTTISSVLIITAIFLVGFYEHSRTVFLIDWFLCYTFLGGSRLLFRLFNEKVNVANKLRRNVLIIGAGDVGEMLLRMLETKSREQYNVVGFIDDDKTKEGKTIHGVKVLGTCKDIPEFAPIFRIDEVLIAIPHLSSEQMKAISRYCKRAEVGHRIVPAVSDLLNGSIHLSKFRKVEISDLFGREAVQLDLTAIRTFLRDKKVMVTGAGGSIGSELCRQIAEYSPERLVLVDKNENYLHAIQCEMNSQFASLRNHCHLCSITNKEKLSRLFELHKPEIVFHAAAHKHVPLSEENPEEAIWNNVIGTQTIADLANQTGVREFVMVSTDKAVNPTSIMGVTKRIAELYIQALSQKSRTKYVTVRFGNVLNSNGSVIPTFEKQIERGGPLTVTHPDVERYFMSIAEAVQLILQAVTMGRNGEVFILEMGKSIRIADLAKELILHSGYKPGEDIEIKYTGLRRGEKLFEELIGKNEESLPTSHTSIKTLKINATPTFAKITSDIFELAEMCQSVDFNTLVERIQYIVPEFDPDYQERIAPLQNGERRSLKARKPTFAYDRRVALSYQ